jgi:hypothetical protein
MFIILLSFPIFISHSFVHSTYRLLPSGWPLAPHHRQSPNTHTTRHRPLAQLLRHHSCPLAITNTACRSPFTLPPLAHAAAPATSILLPAASAPSSYRRLVTPLHSSHMPSECPSSSASAPESSGCHGRGAQGGPLLALRHDLVGPYVCHR